jgi:signal transduction histidine kinase
MTKPTTPKGIDRVTLPRVFEPLFTTKEATGSGLGLWISKQLIEKHGGAIRVRSSTNEPRRGTTISIMLPMSSEQAAQGRAAAAAAK